MILENKVIIVTGAGNGLGRELTLQLLKKGNTVAAVDIRPDYLEETKELAGNMQDRLSLYVTDISDKDAVNALPQTAVDAHGRLDGIINNAGVIQPFVKTADLTDEDIARVMNINFHGPLTLTRAALPFLAEPKEASIANISSMGGFLPVPGQSIYGASKAALKLFTEGLYSELKDSGISVTIVFPGAISTNIAGNSGIKIEGADSSSYKSLSVDKAARQIIRGMEKKKFRLLVGSDSRMMDRMYRLSPKFATNLIQRKMKSLLNLS